MRFIPTLTGLACIAMLGACGTPDRGHYDSNGNYIPPANATTPAQRNHAPSPGYGRDYYGDDYRRGYRGDYRSYYDEPPVIVDDYPYDRRGYYDYNGYYVTLDDRVGVPQEFFPPRGMCRVWIPNRIPEHQPGVESCVGIQSRVPNGAYVIYGG